MESLCVYLSEEQATILSDRVGNVGKESENGEELPNLTAKIRDIMYVNIM